MDLLAEASLKEWSVDSEKWSVVSMKKMTCRITEKALAEYRVRAKCGRIVVFDTETTGISNDDEIVQIAAAEYVDGNLERTLNIYINPTCAVDPRAEAVHHLSQEFLEENGIDPYEALEKFFEFLGNDVLLIGHNIRFDYRMLQNECRKFDFCASFDDISFCDTMALARQVAPRLEHYSLGYLIEELHVTGVNSHDALDDTLACGSLFFYLMKHTSE